MVTYVLVNALLGYPQYLRRHGSRFERDGFDFIVRFHTDWQDGRLEKAYTNAKLSYLQQRPKLLIVIDESHNLRNATSGRYKTLMNDLLTHQGSTRDVKVLLLSATPINNGLIDICNQFNLIAKGNDGYFSGDDFEVKSLQELFREAQKKLNEWSENDERRISNFISVMPQRFFNLTDRLIVARTRSLIEKTLGEDLHFSQKIKPLNIYKGVAAVGKYKNILPLYDALISLNLTAYQLSKYMTVNDDTKRDWQDNRFREEFLVKMMTTLFLKRLESSWYSCKLTIDKVLAVHQHTLDLVCKYQLGNGNADINTETIDEVGDDEFTLRNNTIRLADMQFIDKFKNDLKRDVNKLSEIAASFH